MLLFVVKTSNWHNLKKLIQNERNPVRHGSNRILRLEIIQEIIPMKKTVRYLKKYS